MIGIHEALLALVITSLTITSIVSLEKKVLGIRASLDHADEIRTSTVVNPHKHPCITINPEVIECESSASRMRYIVRATDAK